MFEEFLKDNSKKENENIFFPTYWLRALKKKHRSTKVPGMFFKIRLCDRLRA